MKNKLTKLTICNSQDNWMCLIAVRDNFVTKFVWFFSTVALDEHCPSLASSHHCIFASSSSWHWVCRYSGGFRSITSSHLRNLGSPDFLIPSPQLPIFATSQLGLSRFSDPYCQVLHCNALYHCWLRHAGCISQDTYLLYSSYGSTDTFLCNKIHSSN